MLEIGTDDELCTVDVDEGAAEVLEIDIDDELCTVDVDEGAALVLDPALMYES